MDTLDPTQEPTQLQSVANWAPLGLVYDLAVAGNTAYLLAGLDDSIHRVDLSNPATIYKINAHLDTLPLEHFAVQDNHVFMLPSEGGLEVLDISRPLQAVKVGALAINGDAIKVSGAFAFISNSEGDVSVVDVTQLSHPRLLYSYPALGYVRNMDIVGEYAYLPHEKAGLRIIQIDITGRLLEVGHYPMSAVANRVVVKDGYAYIAAGEAGLLLVDIRDPHFPKLLANFKTAGAVVDVALIAHYALIAEQEEGVCMLDIADPAQPREVSIYPTLNRPRHIITNEEFVYVIDTFGGLFILALAPVSK